MLNSDVDFNPRLREGGDGFYWSKHCKRCLISIHASAKEATFEHLLYVLDEHIFQSTPPRRRRPLMGSIVHSKMNFNPRLREGGDVMLCTLQAPLWISIHASAKEATIRSVCIPTRERNFNPRLREGGDVSIIVAPIVINNFNPRLREGGDVYRTQNNR